MTAYKLLGGWHIISELSVVGLPCPSTLVGLKVHKLGKKHHKQRFFSGSDDLLPVQPSCIQLTSASSNWLGAAAAVGWMAAGGW